MRRGILAVVMTAAAMLTTNVRADQLLGSFEGNLNSALPEATPFAVQNGTGTFNSGANAPQFVATGATQGSTALRLRLVGGFDFGLALTQGSGTFSLRNAFNSNDRLLFDVTIPQIPNQSGDEYVVFVPAINSDGTGGGFKQAPSNLQIVGGGGDNAYNKGTVTMAWDYRAQGILFPSDAGVSSTGGFTQLNLALNSGNFENPPPIAYFDNFRFVTAPEPATLGAAAVAGSLFVRRRRR